jgi:hypothetical protein
MTTFDIQGPTRVCAVSGRELKPGDKYLSVLSDEGGAFVRRDYAADAWPGPPPSAVAFWSGKIPASDRPRKPVFNDELLLDCFDHLAAAAEPDRVNFRYVVALLLMRRKRLKFEDVVREDGGDVMLLRDARNGTVHRVADPRLTEAQTAAVQDEVFRVLGWD